MKSRNQNREKTRKPLGPLLANLTQQYVDKRWPNPKRYFPFWSHLQNQVPQRKVKKFRMGPNVKYLLRLSNLSKLYIPSTLNIDLILWHPQSIVDAVKC